MRLLQWDSARLDPAMMTETDEELVFKDVVFAREIVQKYDDGNALKCGDELKEAYWTLEGRWAIATTHPATAVLMDRKDIQGKTTNIRFVKNLKDEKTKRPMVRGIVGDLHAFKDKLSPEIITDLRDGKRRDVSIGFTFTKDETPGTWNGDSYDYVQRNIFLDHVAFALEEGRCPMPLCGIGADGVIKALDPEETENYIRVPTGEGECTVTATITISEEEGIKALYCGGEKKVRTYLFSKAKEWTMEKAKEWVSTHSDSDMSKDDLKAKFLELKAWFQDFPIDSLEIPEKQPLVPPQWFLMVDWKKPDNAKIYESLDESLKTEIVEALGDCPTCPDEDLDKKDETVKEEPKIEAKTEEAKSIDPVKEVQRHKKLMQSTQ